MEVGVGVAVSTFTARHCILIETSGSATNLSKAAADDHRPEVTATMNRRSSSLKLARRGRCRRQLVKVTTVDK